jgi:hypothetical protein
VISELTAAVLVAVLGGLIGTSLGLLAALKAQAEEKKQTELARQRLQDALKAHKAADQSRAQAVKARADGVSTHAALARIRLDLGQKMEAEAGLRAVLAEHVKIAPDPPANPDYLAVLATTHQHLGQLLVAPVTTELIPIAERQRVVWRYTFQKPAEKWTRPDFDDREWSQGHNGFGTLGTPSAVICTTWNTPDIWIRRAVDVPPSINPLGLQLRVYHGGDIEISLNGVPVVSLSGWTTGYQTIELGLEGLEFIKPGAKVVLAAHCRQTEGDQGIDVGLSAIAPETGRLEEGTQELQHAVAVAQKLDPAYSKRHRISQDVAAAFMVIGEATLWTNRPAGPHGRTKPRRTSSSLPCQPNITHWRTI